MVEENDEIADESVNNFTTLLGWALLAFLAYKFLPTLAEIGMGFVAKIIGAVIVLWILGNSIVIIPQYERGVVLRFGKLHKVLDPGLNFIIPGVDYVVKIDMRTRTIDIKPEDIMSKDNIPLTIDGIAYFRVTHPDKYFVNLREGEYAIGKYCEALLRDEIGTRNLDDILQHRELITDNVETKVNKKLKEWGVKLEDLKIQKIEIPNSLVEAISKQAEAEREKRAIILKAEGEEIAAKKIAEASQLLEKSRAAFQLRVLQTIQELGKQESNKWIILLPTEIAEAIRSLKTGKNQ